jgi:hypothetical protein
MHNIATHNFTIKTLKLQRDSLRIILMEKISNMYKNGLH